VAKVQIGIVGSRFQADCIAASVKMMPDEAEVAAVASPTPGNAEAFARRHGIAKSYTDHRDLLRDPEIELVSITAPNRLHAQITIDAGPSYATAFPTISGTTDQPVGSTLTVGVDADGNGTDDATYTVVVQTGTGGKQSWSIDTLTVTPGSGSLPVAGLSDVSKVTVKGTDPAGNQSTVTSTTISTINSVARAPTMWAPSSSPYFASPTTLTMPIRSP